MKPRERADNTAFKNEPASVTRLGGPYIKQGQPKYNDNVIGEATNGKLEQKSLILLRLRMIMFRILTSPLLQCIFMAFRRGIWRSTLLGKSRSERNQYGRVKTEGYFCGSSIPLRLCLYQALLALRRSDKPGYHARVRDPRCLL